MYLNKDFRGGETLSDGKAQSKHLGINGWRGGEVYWRIRDQEMDWLG